MRACAACGSSLEGRRADAVHCSDRCRLRAFRARRAAARAEEAREARRRRIEAAGPLVSIPADFGSFRMIPPARRRRRTAP